MVAETPSGAFVLDIENRLRSASVLPQDTLVLYSQVGLSEAWEESMSNIDPGIYDPLMEGFEDETASTWKAT